MGRDKIGPIAIDPNLSWEKNRKAPEVAITARRREVVKLYLQSVSQVEIAERLGVAQSTVCEDIKAIHKGWEASAILDWDKLKTKELEAIDHQIEVLWGAWVRSCEVEEVRTRSVKKERRTKTEGSGKNKKVVGEEMVPVEKSNKVQSKQLIGDPRYMAEISRCRELKCKILGFLKDDKGQSVAASQTNIFVLLEEAVKQKADPIEVRLTEEKQKVEQLNVPTE